MLFRPSKRTDAASAEAATAGEKDSKPAEIEDPEEHGAEEAEEATAEKKDSKAAEIEDPEEHGAEEAKSSSVARD